jgi:signal transduction histidine kinase
VISPSSRPDRALAWLVFAVFFALTLLLTSYIWRTTHAADRARFDNAVQTTRDAIEARIDTYLNVLVATRGLVVSDPAISRDELRAYVRSLNVRQRYPGIQGVGLTLRVTRDELPRLGDEMRAEGNASFHIWPRGERAEYYPIVSLEPLDRRNIAALGFDMFTNPVRRAAMERARDTGRAAVSGRVTLVQEIDARKQPGFLIYTPLYSTGTTPATLAQRRASVIGFLYAPFRAYDFFEGIFPSQERPEIGFEIRDDHQFLYRTPELPVDPRYTESDRIEIAGRLWTVRWISRRERGGGVALLTAGTFLGGVAISVLLFLLMRTQLTAREQAERTAERLRRSEAELQRANQAKDEFLATLSHELRTPMTSIMGWAQMLDEEDLDSETARTGIEAVRRSAKVQAQLIDDLLDVSRITAGKMHIERGVLDLQPVVSAAIETVRGAAEAKGVAIQSDLASGVCVNGDPHRLQQVVWNLLSNAVRFTPAGGQVTVTSRDEGRDAVIEVRDTGQGIDPQFMPHLFERFRQADGTATRSHTGLGLGLAIVRHLVELHGGTVSAQSSGLGRGALFRIRIPACERAGSSPPNDAGALEPAAPPLPNDDAFSHTGVAIDDDEDVVGARGPRVFPDS